MSIIHEPVLLAEALSALGIRSGGWYIDGTVGIGGHSEAILEAGGLVLGLDADPEAVRIAQARLERFGSRVRLVHASFAQLETVAQAHGIAAVDGVLFDLGVSSWQLAAAERGFSFQQRGPLDMRFDPGQPLTAADLVNGLPEAELAALLRAYGEERHSRRIARAIVARRPLGTSTDLAQVVVEAAGPWAGGIHPATRTFQALRIAVNAELASLETGLRQAIALLAPGGRLVVIAFHSLEDRIVKQVFQEESRDCICPPRVPVCVCGHRARLEVLTRKPIRPSVPEVSANPRSRSAKMRVAQRYGSP